jgi:hypothetical protein
MGFDAYYTKYTPQINVGISKMVLGETTIESRDIISGIDLIRKLRGNNLWYKGDIERDNYYLQNYDKTFFKSIPTLKFETPDGTLSSIYCVINDDYKSAIIEELNNKYGYNRNSEWKAKGIYRTEINNVYGIIQINLWEFDRILDSDNQHGSQPPVVIKELCLEFYITQLKTTKLQLDKALIKLQNEDLLIEKKKMDLENKKTTVKRLFDLD